MSLKGTIMVKLGCLLRAAPCRMEELRGAEMEAMVQNIIN